MNHTSNAAFAGTTSEDELSARLLALTTEALSFVARDKVDKLIHQWLSGVPWIVHDGHWAFALTLALELAMITPSLMGSTAFDRLARAMPRGRSENDLAGVALLRRSQPCLARLSGRQFEDLSTFETKPLLLSPSVASAGDGVVFGRFAVTGDGSVIATGVLLPLDHDALAVVQRFLRPNGRGLANPVRCAEAVYRHVVRSGAVAADWREPEPQLPFDPERNPLDAFAAEWAALNREPGPEEIARAREFVGTMPLINALVSVIIARDAGAKRLAEAYRGIAAVLVETMAAREAYGSGHIRLDRVAADIDAAIVRDACPPETKTLFNTLRERARLASGRSPGRADGDLDRLVQRIQGLRAKTVEQGCTEAEALAAAEKVAELLDRHGLSMSELDLRKQSCEGIGVETGRKRRGPIDDCVATIAMFFDCRVWGETAADGTLRYVFFGLPGDVQAAVYLHDLIALAFANETASFRAGKFYDTTDTSQRRSATNSFQLGLSRGINAKLNTLRQARAEASGGSNGRALVPVKQSIIEEEMERLGLTFQRVNATRRKVIQGAYTAGKKAGERFDYRPGIAGG